MSRQLLLRYSARPARLFAIAVSCLLTALVAGSAIAQIQTTPSTKLPWNGYAVQRIQNEFSTIVGLNGTTFSHGGDAGTKTVTLPFPFFFIDQDYQSVVVSTNGWLSFLDAPNAVDLTNLEPGVTPDRSVFGFWTDWNPTGTQGVYYRTDGTAPNRVMTFEWYGPNKTNAAVVGNCQVKFFESDDAIEWHFGPYIGFAPAGYRGVVGLKSVGQYQLDEPELPSASDDSKYLLFADPMHSPNEVAYTRLQTGGDDYTPEWLPGSVGSPTGPYFWGGIPTTTGFRADRTATDIMAVAIWFTPTETGDIYETGESITINGRFKNNGVADQEGGEAKADVYRDGVLVTSVTASIFPDPVAYGQYSVSAIATLDNAVTATEGIYEVRLSANLETDENHENDAISGTFQVRDQKPPTNLMEVQIASSLNSGPLDNDDDDPAIVFDQVVQIPNAVWSTAYFSKIELAPGSILRISSVLDGEVQEFDRFTAKMWQLRSAYFNGDKLRFQIEAAPRTRRNCIVLEAIGVQLGNQVTCDDGPCTPCTPDGRVPSNMDWSGRWVLGGCTGSVFNENGCFVSAGHCFTVVNGTVLQFRAPSSLNDCTPQQSPVDDQFIVVADASLNNGCFDDWRVGKLGMNNAGQTHYQRYGVFMPLASGPPPVSGVIDFYGYGSSSIPTSNCVQQQTTATVTSITPTGFWSSGGTITGGSSGSGWVYNNQIVGISTCCAGTCSGPSTRIDHPAFITARRQMCPHTVYTPWDQGFCLNETQTVVPVTICNSSGATDSYQLSFATVPPGPMCSVTGPTSFTVVGPNTVGPVLDGQCITVQVIVGRPAGFTAGWLTGCYDVTVTGVNSGLAVTDRGSVQDIRDLCAQRIGAATDPEPLELEVGVSRQLSFELRNDNVPSGIINYRIEAFGTDMEPSGAIMLDDNYPGVMSTGSVEIPLGETGEIDVTVEYRWLQPFDVSDIVISTDANDDGEYEPLISVGTRSVQRVAYTDPDRTQNFTGLRLLPNPTRGASTIGFTLRETGPVRLRIYDLSGRAIREIINGPLDAGDHMIEWDGKDESGAEVPSGTYVVDLVARGEHGSITISRLR